ALARILTTASTTERTVGDGHAVRGFEAAEIPTLHGAGETATDGDTRHIDELTRHEVRGENFIADFEHVLFVDAEFGNLLARLDFGLREMSALGFGEALRFTKPRTELNGGVAVLLFGARRNDLAIAELQHGNGNVTPIFFEDARHADLLCDYASAHCTV